MRSIWNGSISFGLVNIPIKMFAATENNAIRFRQLHKKCHTPIKYEKRCPACDRVVDAEDIVRGYEYEKDTFVIITDEEIDSLPTSQTKTIDILDFVSLQDIDPVYYDKTYYLTPSETGLKAYSLLYQALSQTSKIGIAQISLRSQRSMAALRLYNDVIVLETMKYPQEVRSTSQLPMGDKITNFEPRELDMAIQLIEALSEPFNPHKYNDDYRHELLSLIEAKITGKEIATPAAVQQPKVVDIMDALKASVEAIQKEKRHKTGSTT